MNDKPTATLIDSCLFTQVLGELSANGRLEGCMFPVDRFRGSMLRLHHELTSRGNMTEHEGQIAALCQRFETLAGHISNEIKEMDRISAELGRLLKESAQ